MTDEGAILVLKNGILSAYTFCCVLRLSLRIFLRAKGDVISERHGYGGQWCDSSVEKMVFSVRIPFAVHVFLCVHVFL